MRSLDLTQPLTSAQVYAVAYNKIPVTISTGRITEIARKHTRFITTTEERIIYGINTGFGPMVHHYISPSDQHKLQYNLIRSHACGVGTHLPALFVRAIMLTRLNSLLQGYSAVSRPVIEALVTLLNTDTIPRIPEHGSVGASGDLVQLAHIALCLIGEGEIVTPQGYKHIKKHLRKNNLTAITLRGRDGLALINGTSAMTGIAAIVLVEAHRLLQNSIALSALLYELFQVNSEHIAPLVGNVRPHAGQIFVADTMRIWLKTSKNVRPYLSKGSPTPDEQLKEKSPQAIYSLRCVPQILGPVFDTIQNARSVTDIELNAVTDNPLFDENTLPTHNGNFHGDYIAHEMDKVRIALTKLSMLMERQLNLLVNPALNHSLPPYVNRNRPGLDLALQAVQFVATSTTAENQTLTHPMVTHSIPTNNDNQDVVSMGCNSALLTNRVLENSYQVQAALTLAVIEAIDLTHTTLTKPLAIFYEPLRHAIEPITTDRPLTNDLEQLITILKKAT